MSNRRKRTITISDKHIYTPRLESSKEMPTSPFADIYRDAMKSLAYVCKQTVYERSANGTGGECNPIIAFVGERGSGKTSVLDSFGRVLDEGYSQASDDTIWLNDAILQGSKFDVLPIIDPTALTKNESLLGVIAAHIYRQIEQLQDKRLDRPKCDYLDTTIRNAAQQLMELYNALRALNQERSEQFVEFGGYERLGQLSISYNLRVQFKNAVDAYLKLTAQIRDRSSYVDRHRFLVIPIDDLDMNADAGYKLCEELRRYMMVPGIIVLLSVKIEQLQNVIAQEHVSHSLNKEDAISMAERYLAKLIPINHRHALPIFTVHNIIDCIIAQEESEKPKPLVDTLIKLLYDRLGLILIKNDFNSHVILPRTLRRIVHLYYLLLKMPPVFAQCNSTPLEYDDDRIQNIGDLSHNIDTFWDHFLRSEMEELAAPVTMRKLLEQMRSEHWSSINRLVVKEIKVILESKTRLPEESDHWDSIEDICSVETMQENVSLGDALYMLDRLETWIASPEWNCIVALIRIAYSLLLTRMFFIDQRPDIMRRFIIQLNNPDKQELVRTSREDAIETLTWQRRRDWNFRLDWKTIGLRGEKDSLLAKYYAEIGANADRTAKEIINSESPLKWLILNIVWCGYQRSMNKSSTNWRSIWDEPYLNSTELLDSSQTKNITVNYIAFITNLLNPSALWNQNPEKTGTDFVMVFPLYSTDLIQYVVSQSHASSHPKKVPENKDFGYFEYFVNGIIKSIKNLNKMEDSVTKHPYTIAMVSPKMTVMESYSKVHQIQSISAERDEKPDKLHKERLLKILHELEAQNVKNRVIARTAGTLVGYCNKIIQMIDSNGNFKLSRDSIIRIKQLNEKLPTRGRSASGTQEKLIDVINQIISRYDKVRSNG